MRLFMKTSLNVYLGDSSMEFLIVPHVETNKYVTDHMTI